MSIDIEPLELSFRRPFTVEVSQTLTIKNPTSTPLAFKVKTTAPRQYCVRPNAGRIEAGSDFGVSVLLQAMKADPPQDAKCRDKFLVQSAPITPDKEFDSISSVLESADKSQIQERKIRVNWLSAESDDNKNQATPRHALSTPNKKSLNDAAIETPEATGKYSSPATSAPSPGPPVYTSDNAKDDAEGHEANKSVVATAATTVQETYEEIKKKLMLAEEELAGLRTSGLRRRNVKSGEGTDREAQPVARAAQAVKQTVEGVPVHVVAVLCIVSFLLAYFFF